MKTKPKTYSVKILPSGKGELLNNHIANELEKDSNLKPVDVLVNLLNNDSQQAAEGIFLADLGLDENTQLEGYGNQTEAQLVTRMFVDDEDFIDLNMLKKCMVAMAKTDFSRSASGTQWTNKVDKQAMIHEKVQQQMVKNDAITDEFWYERELINTKWISVNCNTSMMNGDEYMVEHQKEVDEHNLRVRTVGEKDLGTYFNRSARAKKKKLNPVVTQSTQVVTQSKPVKTQIKPVEQSVDDEILGADGEPL